MPTLDQLQKLWQLTTEQMKKRTSSIAIWQAMESAVVLDCEGENPVTLIVGLAGENYSRSGHLLVPETRNLIEQLLTKITQQPLSFRVVECASPAEWQNFKLLEERKRAAQMAMSSGAKRAEAAPEEAAPVAAEQPVPTATNLDEVLDRAYKVFASLPNRTYVQTRSRFVRDATRMLAQAEEQLFDSGQTEESIARAVNRALEKIAIWGQCDSMVVALEYMRHKENL